MKEIVDQIRSYLASPDYEQAILFWLSNLAQSQEFMAQSECFHDKKFIRQVVLSSACLVYRREVTTRTMFCQIHPQFNLVRGMAYTSAGITVFIHFTDLIQGVILSMGTPEGQTFSRFTGTIIPPGSAWSPIKDQDIN